ncbi:MAG: YHS domain-containing protein [Cohaesibacter sp.]|nr:YHS domain-containing protein [Cohaesibacter sp.]
MFFALALASIGWVSSSAWAAKDPVYQSFLGTAISGTDPVSYFKDGRPIEGKSNITYEWNGATWRFASNENRDLFAAAPEKYAPQYGGYCAWAVSQGYTASTDPEAWSIVDGKLYLNYSKAVRKQWEQDIPGNIKSADKNWPNVLK